ncbi:hypothetical protein THEMA_05305 [Thermotoga maritima MSB8]|nr:hypothetical protein THEMA_05305 [Thermotoga maritima MSB8]
MITKILSIFALFVFAVGVWKYFRMKKKEEK